MIAFEFMTWTGSAWLCIASLASDGHGSAPHTASASAGAAVRHEREPQAKVGRGMARHTALFRKHRSLVRNGEASYGCARIGVSGHVKASHIAPFRRRDSEATTRNGKLRQGWDWRGYTHRALSGAWQCGQARTGKARSGMAAARPCKVGHGPASHTSSLTRGCSEVGLGQAPHARAGLALASHTAALRRGCRVARRSEASNGETGNGAQHLTASNAVEEAL